MTVPPAHAQSQAVCLQACRAFALLVSPFCILLPGLNRVRCVNAVAQAHRACRQVCRGRTAAAAIPATTPRSPGRGPY